MSLRPVLFKFEAFTLDVGLCALRTAQHEIELRPKAFEVLRVLVENAGRLVQRDELISAIWPNATVTEESLTQCVSEARQALGDRDHTMIKTMARRGYLFTPPVDEIWQDQAEARRGAVPAPRSPRPAQQYAHDVTEHEKPVFRLPELPSIALLPFTNMSGDPEQDHFADGIVEDVLSALSRIRWLFVIARQSSFSYRGRAVDARQIGRELGVRYLVEGSVRKAGDRVRVTAQLIDAETEAHIWADRYEGRLGEIFALQDEITQQIVTAIEPKVRAVEIKRARAKAGESLTAYDLCLRALPGFHAQSEEGVKRAEVLLRKAVELDPEYPEALGMLTDCLMIRTMNGWNESVTRAGAEACEFARRALAAGPDDSTCVVAAAFALAYVPGLGHRHEEARELAERAIELHPNSAFVRSRAGAVYAYCGESDKAIMQYEAAQRMSPGDSGSSALTFTGIAGAHFFARRFDDCVHWGRRAVALAPGANIARRLVAAAAAHQSRADEARAEMAVLLKHQPNASLARSRTSSFPYDWMHELYLEGLRKAGLPES